MKELKLRCHLLVLGFVFLALFLRDIGYHLDWLVSESEAKAFVCCNILWGPWRKLMN